MPLENVGKRRHTLVPSANQYPDGDSTSCLIGKVPLST